MIVNLSDNFRVVIDQYNHKLESYREVINPKDKSTKMNWCFVGYYPNMDQAVNGAIKSQLGDSQEVVTFYKYLDKLVTTNMEMIVKRKESK